MRPEILPYCTVMTKLRTTLDVALTREQDLLFHGWGLPCRSSDCHAVCEFRLCRGNFSPPQELNDEHPIGAQRLLYPSRGWFDPWAFSASDIPRISSRSISTMRRTTTGSCCSKPAPSSARGRKGCASRALRRNARWSPNSASCGRNCSSPSRVRSAHSRGVLLPAALQPRPRQQARAAAGRSDRQVRGAGDA